MTNEFRIPTVKTKRNHTPTPEKMVPLFSVHPLGDANVTGTPISNKNEMATNANKLN